MHNFSVKCCHSLSGSFTCLWIKQWNCC